MSRPPYPHRCLGGDPFVWACRCKATPKVYSAETARDGWGSGCRVAMEVKIADLEIRLGAAHDQLADIAALARGEMEPDVRSGGAPVLCEAWEAVKALRVRAKGAEALAAAAIERADVAEARCDALEERMVTADVPWRVPGCQCPVDSKPDDRCDARWTRCNARLQWLKALKATGEGR